MMAQPVRQFEALVKIWEAEFLPGIDENPRHAARGGACLDLLMDLFHARKGHQPAQRDK